MNSVPTREPSSLSYVSGIVCAFTPTAKEFEALNFPGVEVRSPVLVTLEVVHLKGKETDKPHFRARTLFSRSG